VLKLKVKVNTGATIQRLILTARTQSRCVDTEWPVNFDQISKYDGNGEGVHLMWCIV